MLANTGYYYYNYNHLDFFHDYPGDQYQKKHSPTPVLSINHPSSASSIYCDPWHPPYSIYVSHSLFAQPLFKSSSIYLLVWHRPLHTPYISSKNHCLLFAGHAHAIATCFAVVPRLYHLILFSVSTVYLELLSPFYYQ